MKTSKKATLSVVLAALLFCGPLTAYGLTEISTLQGLQNINNDLSDSYILTADIDASGDLFVPIGGELDPFWGSFDGNGHVISNLTINLPTTDYVGLFGYVWGTIQNVRIENIDITGSSFVGGLVGSLGDGSVTKSYATGNVTGVGDYTGGLIGLVVDATVSECYSAGTVEGGNDDVGGLIGRILEGNVSNCYSLSEVTGWNNGTGGLIGYNFTENIAYCYSAGLVDGDENVGGLVGSDRVGVSPDTNYWDTVTSEQDDSAMGTGKTTALMKQQATFVGWDFSTVWNIEAGVTYPYLRHFGYEPPPLNECIWLGGSTSWDTSSNWSTGFIPDDTDDVIVPLAPTGGSSFPIIGTSISAIAGSVRIEGGSIIIQGGGELTIL